MHQEKLLKFLLSKNIEKKLKKDKRKLRIPEKQHENIIITKSCG